MIALSGAKPLNVSRPMTVTGRRAEMLRLLRRKLPHMEGFGPLPRGGLAFGGGDVDGHLPQGGLALGALHEIAPRRHDDWPAAFGFAAALAARMAREQDGPVVLVAARGGCLDFGRPYAPGLDGFGLDASRLLLVEAGTEQDALWALEEVLRARAALAVIGCLDRDLPLKASRRLHLAASGSGCLLLILKPPGEGGATAAATRWHVAAAPARRDRFGLLDHAGWHIILARARNGRPGEWRMEWDHAAGRFGVAATVADHSLPAGAGERIAAAGHGAG
jgi:protein ImuA